MLPLFCSFCSGIATWSLESCICQPYEKLHTHTHFFRQYNLFIPFAIQLQAAVWAEIRNHHHTIHHYSFDDNYPCNAYSTAYISKLNHFHSTEVDNNQKKQKNRKSLSHKQKVKRIIAWNSEAKAENSKVKEKQQLANIYCVWICCKSNEQFKHYVAAGIEHRKRQR